MIESALPSESLQWKKKKAAEVYPFLEAYIARKEQLIAEIEQVVKPTA